MKDQMWQRKQERRRGDHEIIEWLGVINFYDTIEWSNQSSWRT